MKYKVGDRVKVKCNLCGIEAVVTIRYSTGEMFRSKESHECIWSDNQKNWNKSEILGYADEPTTDEITLEEKVDALAKYLGAEFVVTEKKREVSVRKKRK